MTKILPLFLHSIANAKMTNKINKTLTLNLQNFLNGHAQLSFLGLFIINFGDIKMKIDIDTEPLGQTIHVHFLFTATKTVKYVNKGHHGEVED